jgi:hypothetical protein
MFYGPEGIRKLITLQLLAHQITRLVKVGEDDGVRLSM